MDRNSIYDIVLKNAFLHSGKADYKAVMNKVMGSFPEARADRESTVTMIREVIDEVNSKSEEEISKIIAEKFPEELAREKKLQEHRLPDLENVGEFVVMRMAPSPSGPLHIGHSRMAILNDEYVKRYGGHLILRIEDTNPKNIDPESYSMIPQDLKFLGVNVTDTVIQSDRFPIYYEQARILMENGHMYVCSCNPEEFRKLKLQGEACPHRSQKPDENTELFRKMLSDRKFATGKTVVLKTDLHHPNPSIRDWIAFRVLLQDHPRTGNRYWVYPTMNFSVAVDDHLLGLTHVIRGKDHLNNTDKQRYIFRYNGWKEPEYYHYGLVRIPDAMLHASEMKAGIRSGKYTGWGDVRLPTILALSRRGYAPETFRRYWVESGMREIDSEFSWDIFNSINREIIDPVASRYFFVPSPVPISINFPDRIVANILLHPGKKDGGARRYEFHGKTTIYVTNDDSRKFNENEIIRLKDLCNVIWHGGDAEFAGAENTRKDVKIIHWTPENSIPYEVDRPDGTVVKGLLEPLGSEYDGVAQFERFGYVRMFRGSGKAYFLHR